MVIQSHVDNGREYFNEKFKSYHSEAGIELQTTAPYTPEQNPRAERDMHTIVESAQSRRTVVLMGRGRKHRCLYFEQNANNTSAEFDTDRNVDGETSRVRSY